VFVGVLLIPRYDFHGKTRGEELYQDYETNFFDLERMGIHNDYDQITSFLFWIFKYQFGGDEKNNEDILILVIRLWS